MDTLTVNKKLNEIFRNGLIAQAKCTIRVSEEDYERQTAQMVLNVQSTVADIIQWAVTADVDLNTLKILPLS